MEVDNILDVVKLEVVVGVGMIRLEVVGLGVVKLTVVGLGVVELEVVGLDVVELDVMALVVLVVVEHVLYVFVLESTTQNPAPGVNPRFLQLMVLLML